MKNRRPPCLRLFCLAAGLVLAEAACFGQSQIDFRGLFSFSAEKKMTRQFSLTGMVAGIQTYDFQELGFAWADVGAKYKINRYLGVNLNYRPLWSRNLRNFYRVRHLVYADLDFGFGRGRWSFGGTSRWQQSGFAEILEGRGGTSSAWLNRNRLNVKYRVDYFWQPFVEAEIFVPIGNPQRRLPDQWRASLGVSRTFSRFFRLELVQQLQRQMNRAPKNTNFQTGLNGYFRF